MPEILIDGDIGWFDPGPVDAAQIVLLRATTINKLSAEVEAARLRGLQDAWDCPTRGTVRKATASARMKRNRQLGIVTQQPHSDERRAQTSERMKEVWAKRKAAKEASDPIKTALPQ